MKHPLSVVICCFLLPILQATSFGSTSAVISSQDVLDGLNSNKMHLTDGEKYRVYAVYASDCPTDSYARKVFVVGVDGSNFTVATLAKPKAGTVYVLDETNVLIAPITITDKNNANKENRVPFTIYIVSDGVPTSPVVSAKLVGDSVDSSIAKIDFGLVSSGCTVLSAEISMMLSDIDTGSMDSVVVTATGFDADPSTYTVLTVNKQSPGSSVLISGPIASLFNSNPAPSTFSFTFQRDGPLSSSIQPGASFTLLSNNWLSMEESYTTALNNYNTRLRDFDFGQETRISFTPLFGDYHPPGDFFKIHCNKDTGGANVYDCGDLAGTVQKDACTSIKLIVATNTYEGFRFMVQVHSGAFSTSITALLLASLVGIFTY